MPSIQRHHPTVSFFFFLYPYKFMIFIEKIYVKTTISKIKQWPLGSSALTKFALSFVRARTVLLHTYIKSRSMFLWKFSKNRNNKTSGVKRTHSALNAGPWTFNTKRGTTINKSGNSSHRKTSEDWCNQQRPFAQSKWRTHNAIFITFIVQINARSVLICAHGKFTRFRMMALNVQCPAQRN